MVSAELVSLGRALRLRAVRYRGKSSQLLTQERHDRWESTGHNK
jgi:hypothetical protein